MTTHTKAEEMPDPTNIHIVGCGRHHRCDDQIGLSIATRLAEEGVDGARIMTTECPATDILDDLEAAKLLVVVDAAEAGGAVRPGHWQRIDYATEPDRIREECRTDTHTLSVGAALGMATQLGMLPETVWVYAIAVGDVGYGDEITPAVATAADEVAQAIQRDVAAWRETRGSAHA